MHRNFPYLCDGVKIHKQVREPHRCCQIIMNVADCVAQTLERVDNARGRHPSPPVVLRFGHEISADVRLRDNQDLIQPNRAEALSSFSRHIRAACFKLPYCSLCPPR
eukprot:SAG11_NODE_1913_length_4076_cov_10.003520_4_plen_107_part_00